MLGWVEQLGLGTSNHAMGFALLLLPQLPRLCPNFLGLAPTS